MSTDQPPPALATQKRKFYKLLDNVTNKSSTSLASTLQESNASAISLVDPNTPPFKRLRVSMDRPRDASGERIKALQEKLLAARKGIGRDRQVGVRAVGPETAPTKPSTPRKTPNFAPYSQEQFLRRLQTFADVKKWTSKPDVIGEVAWAKRGWVCAGWNTVACRGACEQRVAVRLRSKRKNEQGKEVENSEDFAVEVEEGLVERYQQLIVDGHDEDCLWRKAGCKDDIYHIPIPNRDKSLAELLERYRSFKPSEADLPLLKNIMYPDPPISEILKRIPSKVWNPLGSTVAEQPPTSPTDTVAFMFALFGWSGIKEANISLAVCNHCFQRLGLWLSSETYIKETSKKLDVPIDSLTLNLLESHRDHCPWKNSVTQANPRDGPIKDMAGWQTLQFMIMEKKRKEHMRGQSVEVHGDGDELSEWRNSLDSYTTAGDSEKKDGESLNEKWKRFKARLRRTTSRKSLKSVKSARSVKSAKSVNGDKENEGK
ncbi:zf-C3HC-domain-containing protein [Lojkania enalia]|uniref:Zf-C3HC-domain-containing protein n=1 Tax=Lojkania enalia TaxID=147567 RepID=A0A9P4K5U7_9PLEO|nr:zf-C3HC-domain-containing protein [Didymosphaeria enalia]